MIDELPIEALDDPHAGLDLTRQLPAPPSELILPPSNSPTTARRTQA